MLLCIWHHPELERARWFIDLRLASNSDEILYVESGVLIFKILSDSQLCSFNRPALQRRTLFLVDSCLYSAPISSNFCLNRRADERPFFWHTL